MYEGLVSFPDPRGLLPGFGADALGVHGQQAAVPHQDSSGYDRGGNHAFMKPEDDVPGEIAGSQGGMRVIIDKDQVSVGTRRQDTQGSVGKELTCQGSIMVYAYACHLTARHAPWIPVPDFVEQVGCLPLLPHGVREAISPEANFHTRP